MTARNTVTAAPPYPVETALRTLGANIRTARVRRGLTAQELGRKIGVGRDTVAEAEKGKPSTSVAVYAGLLWALGMIDQLVAVADPAADDEGRALALAREPKRARRTETLDNDF
jgi:transcriptional regulator with XRE-family HTH domain